MENTRFTTRILIYNYTCAQCIWPETIATIGNIVKHKWSATLVTIGGKGIPSYYWLGAIRVHHVF